MKDHFHFHLIKVFAGKKPKNVKLVDDKLSFFLEELQEINEEGEPTVTKEQNSEEDEDQAWIPINLFFITFDHI